MARPRLPVSKLKSHSVTFWLTEDEHSSLSQNARQVSMSVNALARLLTLSGNKRLVIKTHTLSDPAVIKRLDRVCYTVNQLVKKAHVFGEIPPELISLSNRIQSFIDRNLDGITKR